MYPEHIEMEHYLELDVGSSSEFNERIYLFMLTDFINIT